jgi:orotidine-5'-phosphate decarboxylase
VNGIEKARGHIIVALDVETRGEALKLANDLRDYVGLFKVGLELLNAEGINIVRELVGCGGKVFLDGKFNDIPNTVAGASRAAVRLGVSMLNVHAMGGIDMMKAAADAARDEANRIRIKVPLILGVTILTSIDKITLNRELRIHGDIETQVVHLAVLAKEAGLDGVVASPQEASAIISRLQGNIVIVTPGVRPIWADSGDQKRIMTPSEAITNGAEYLVIGRPITRPPADIGTPVDAARRIAEEIADALDKRRN